MTMRPMFVACSLTLCWALGAQAGQPTVEEVRDRVRGYRSQHEADIVRGLAALVALPNDAAHLDDMTRNASELRKLLAARGFEVSPLETAGAPPLVLGRRLVEGAGRTVVFYAHYDGQPVDPERWTDDPYRAVLRTGRVEDGARELELGELEPPLDPEWRLYGRSTADDKVSIAALLAAVDALDASGITPSVNITILLDGEEERGSPHIAGLLGANREQLAADLWVFCDGPVHQTRLPQVVYGVRGVTSVQITAYGPAVGLHSGHYGNWAPDPGMSLARLVSSLRDDDGEVLVDGIAELVRPMSAAAAAAVAATPPVDEQLKAELALAWTEGEPEPLAERITRPAANLLGFEVGAVGTQAANVISPRARAVVGFRLVPEVTPEAMRAAVENHIRSRGFHIVGEEPDAARRRAQPRIVRLEWEDGYPALWTDMELPLAKAVARIVDEAVDGPIVLAPSLGGSLPLAVFSDALGGPPIVVVPIANHDNNQHTADENIRLANLWRGIEIYAALMAGL
ncbi:MAG TPA: M20/M25/M40 family metallo-hydrolase [Chondromyces sp.]|nr:M20/M25/M40 family metallo-hydrolase [Chondromyces sp.]